MKSILKSGLALVSAAAVAGFVASCGSRSASVEIRQGSEIEYSLSLFRNLLSEYPEAENVTLSPYSAGVALSMLAEGANGQTLDEIDKALSGCRLRAGSLPVNDSVTVASANSIWINKDYPVKKNYVELLNRSYDAIARTLDFSSLSSVACINSWARENTAGKIDNVVKELGPQMVAVLANAIYFKGAWEYPFKESDTRIRPFAGASAKSDVKFMTRSGSYEYAEYRGNQMVRIPYFGGDYAMTVFLPAEGMALSAAGDYLYEQWLSKSLDMLEPQQVLLRLPKFKVEGEISLVSVLRKMGVVSAFSSEAELGGIADGPLTVSEVNQKTFVNVDEMGSEAAAVTTIGIRLTSVPMVNPDVKVMDVNRPFFYMISEVETGRILFIGRISNL